jgi:SAM-dependent methyltransferase
MPPPRLYTDLSHLWPLLSPPEDCAAEAGLVRQLLTSRLRVRGRKLRVLELGAGAGHSLMHLRDIADPVAVDLSEAMLALCRAVNPGVPTIVGDMRSVVAPGAGRYDAVLIHDAADYLLSEADVRSTFANAHRHLRKGGLLLAAPTYVTETFENGHAAVDRRVGDDGLDVTYLSYAHDPDARDTTFELILVYLIRQQRGVTIEEDRHRCGLFPLDAWLTWMDEAGFRSEAVDAGGQSPHVMLVGQAR